MTNRLISWMLAAILSTSAVEHPTSPPSLTIRNGTVSGRVSGAPLAHVMTLLSRETGAVVQGLGMLDERSTTVDFAGVPLAEAMERLLAPASFMMTFDEDGRLLAVTIVSRGPAAEAALPAAPPLESEKELVEQTDRPDEAVLIADMLGASEHIARIEALTMLREKPSTPAAQKALVDLLQSESDASIRRQALDQLRGAGEDVPLGPIMDVARYDPDSDLRVDALGTLVAKADNPDARAMIAWLVDNDGDERVRAIAADALTDVSKPRQARRR